MTPSNSEILLHWIPHFDTTVMNLTLEGYQTLVEECLKTEPVIALFALEPLGDSGQMLRYRPIGHVKSVEGIDNDLGVVIVKALLATDADITTESPLKVNARCTARYPPYSERSKLLSVAAFFIIP